MVSTSSRLHRYAWSVGRIVYLLSPITHTFAQAIVYTEAFPHPGTGGNVSLGSVGWTNYIPNDPERIYSWSGTNGVVFAWEAAANVPVTTAFLTTTALDDGSKGMPFPAFNPADTPGLAFNVDIRPGYDPDNGPEPHPSTPLGQKNFLLQCFNDLKLVADGHCIGDLYWDPVFICVPGQGWQNGAPNAVGNTTLFNFSGSALPSLDAFQFNN